MRVRTLGLLLLGLLSACQALPVSPSARVSARAGAAASPAGNGPTMGDAGAAASTTAASLQSPATVVSGTLEMDASYVIAAGGGNVVAGGGGNVIAAGGGNVVSTAGANVIPAGGGNVIAAGGGNVHGGSSYRLADAEATPVPAASVPVGTILPAAGMLVVPVSLATNEQLGDAVLTDAQGHYTVRVPQSYTGAFRLVAMVPAKTPDAPWLRDPRLQYTLITAAGRDASSNVIDEDTSAVTAYLTDALYERVLDLLKNGLSSKSLKQLSNSPLASIAKAILEAMTQADTAHMDPAKREALAHKMVGIWLGNGEDVYFSARCVADGKLLGFTPTAAELAPLQSGRPALQVLVDVMREMRAHMTDLMRAHGADAQAYINAKPYIRAALAKHDVAGDPLQGFVIKRPEDLLTYVLYAYNAQGGTFSQMSEFTGDPDMGYADPMAPLVETNGAAEGIADALTLKLFVNPTQDALVQAIKDAGN